MVVAAGADFSRHLELEEEGTLARRFLLSSGKADQHVADYQP